MTKRASKKHDQSDKKSGTPEERPTPGGRIVAFIPEDGHVQGHGWRVAHVVEGEKGYRPTGTWPFTGAADEKMPWFWGPSIEEARAEAKLQNERRGISEMDAMIIIAQSMA